MSIDYDQLLAKRPASPDSIFAWHQDLAYWPPLEFDPSTCTCWLAIDDSTVANGQGWGCPTVRTRPSALTFTVRSHPHVYGSTHPPLLVYRPSQPLSPPVENQITRFIFIFMWSHLGDSLYCIK